MLMTKVKLRLLFDFVSQVNFPSTSYFHRWSLSNSDKEDYSMVLIKMEGDAEKKFAYGNMGQYPFS